MDKASIEDLIIFSPLFIASPLLELQFKGIFFLLNYYLLDPFFASSLKDSSIINYKFY